MITTPLLYTAAAHRPEDKPLWAAYPTGKRKPDLHADKSQGVETPKVTGDAALPHC